jgi:LPXTG-motif cell wall-anchored protein
MVRSGRVYAFSMAASMMLLVALPGVAAAQVADPACVPSGVGPVVAGTALEPTGSAAAAPALAGDTLPRTGASVVLPVALGVLLVCIGVLLVVLARRSRRAPATLALLFVAAALAALVDGAAAPASAQVVDPCAPPVPVIPEAPLAVLLPASALVVAAAFVAVKRSGLGRSPAALPG